MVYRQLSEAFSVCSCETSTVVLACTKDTKTLQSYLSKREILDVLDSDAMHACLAYVSHVHSACNNKRLCCKSLT